MNFEEYWNAFGELHADMCKGNIKVFAEQIWASAQGNVEDGPPGENE